MKLINGKFIDDNGSLIPIKIGDKEQIALLKKNQLKQDVWSKGIHCAHSCVVEFEYGSQFKYYQIEGKCPCGSEFNSGKSQYKCKETFDGDEISCLDTDCELTHTLVFREDLDQIRAVESSIYEEYRKQIY